jgi:hypothetical protein
VKQATIDELAKAAAAQAMRIMSEIIPWSRSRREARNDRRRVGRKRA